MKSLEGDRTIGTNTEHYTVLYINRCFTSPGVVNVSQTRAHDDANKESQKGSKEILLNAVPCWPVYCTWESMQPSVAYSAQILT